MDLSDFKIAEAVEIVNCAEHGDYEQKVRSIMGKIFRSKCPVCSSIQAEKYKAAHALAEEREHQARLERQLDRVGIPHRFRGKLFSNFIAETDAKRKALAIAKEFADEFEAHAKNGTTAIFSGSPGTGKSHLALAIAAQVMDKTTVFYINALDAIRMVRDTWRKDSERSESDVLEYLGDVGLLIIDEVGMQYGTEGEQVIMFDIINRRYRDMMSTILLTNLGKQGLKDYLGDRSFDRLREDGIWIPFDWESFRVKRVA